MKLADLKPYHFLVDGIKLIEEKHNAKYMGYWCSKHSDGSWNEQPVDVFYVANPDRSLGHSNYFGMFLRGDKVYINNAESCFSEPITGIVDGGTVYASRYRHDYTVTPGGGMIDGGRDYVRSSISPVLKDNIDLAESKLRGDIRFVTITVNGGEFVFTEQFENEYQI